MDETVKLLVTRDTANALQRAVRGQKAKRADADFLRWGVRLEDGRRLTVVLVTTTSR